MVILFIIGLLLGAVSVFFALQNTIAVTVTFFQWQFSGSLALLILLAIITGILITLLFLLPEFIGNYVSYRRLQKVNMRLVDELEKQKTLTLFAKRTAPTAEDIRNIENGAIAVPPIQHRMYNPCTAN